MSKKIHSDQAIAELKSLIGPRMRAARKVLGITQEDAAETIGISAEFYARMERGHALPSVGTLAKMAAALQVTVDHLFGAESNSAQGSPLAALAIPKDSRQLLRIVEMARRDPELRKVLTALLKRCAQTNRNKSDD